LVNLRSERRSAGKRHRALPPKMATPPAPG